MQSAGTTSGLLLNEPIEQAQARSLETIRMFSNGPLLGGWR